MDEQVNIQQIALVIPLIREHAGLKIWMQTRKTHDELNGLLEFAGGKLEQEELPLDAALREFQEEVGVLISRDALELFKLYSYDYPKKSILFHAYLWRVPEERLKSLRQEGWFDLLSDWKNVFEGRVPPANLQILHDLYEFGTT